MRLRHRIRSIEWEAVAGLIAAVLALVLHFLHIIEEGVLVMITLVLLSLLFIRDLRREEQTEEIATSVERTENLVRDVRGALPAPSVELIGPESLRSESARFGRNASGDMVWFHVCLLMFRPQSLFDALLRPAIENPNVDSIQFVLDESERENWRAHVEPKVAACEGHDTVEDPLWYDLDESVSFIITDHVSGESQALLSFWGEPFMARTTERDVPRYIFRVYEESGLLSQFREMERMYRLRG
ncbi:MULTISPECIES: hypothetical protein [Haloprofundus]|uniref:hypothetical protein n=1 Tax=Haloprofundus TaxID=1911573 RepID=UPI000E44DD18|nr:MULTISPECIES: hypothetical protein [Haloprofundus]QCJ45867.1 hypothetical protein FCF25_01465 [Haloprofundus sp. MHR1]